MKTLRPALGLALAASALALSGCAKLPDRIASLFHRPTVETRTIVQETKRAKVVDLAAVAAAAEPAALAASRTDRLYNQAVGALKARQYGQALELLQMARADAREDPRVLNALGVTYDKLGRFDLSDRYYRSALLADPGSSVVRSNMQYSALLQGQSSALAALAPHQLPKPPKPAEIAQPFRLAQAESAARVESPVLVGRPLLLVNASGAPTLGAQVHAKLTDRGWSVASHQVARERRAGGAQLTFPEQHNAAAFALARTLPFAVEMVACRNGCEALTLTLGVETKWKS